MMKAIVGVILGFGVAIGVNSHASSERVTVPSNNHHIYSHDRQFRSMRVWCIANPSQCIMVSRNTWIITRN